MAALYSSIINREYPCYTSSKYHSFFFTYTFTGTVHRTMFMTPVNIQCHQYSYNIQHILHHNGIVQQHSTISLPLPVALPLPAALLLSSQPSIVLPVRVVALACLLGSTSYME